MLGSSDESSISNIQKMQILKEQLRKVDSLQPKSFMNTQNPLQMSASNIEDTFHQPSKPNHRTSVNQNEAVPLDIKYCELEEKMSLKMQGQYRVLEGLDIEINSLQEQIRMGKKEVDRGKQNVEERAASIERQANQEVLEQIEEIKSIRKQLIDSIEKKYRTIKTETMAVMGNHFESGWEEAKEELSSKIDDLKCRIDSEASAKDEAVNLIVNNFGEQILKLEQMVQKQKQERQESHHKILTSLQQVEQQITTMVFQERKEANHGIAELENYLEELCFKIQNCLLH